MIRDQSTLCEVSNINSEFTPVDPAEKWNISEKTTTEKEKTTDNLNYDEINFFL